MSDVASEDEYMRCVGHLMQNASAADHVMFSAFRDLMGSTVKVARAIYFTFESIPPKRKLITRVAELKKDSTIDEIVVKLCDAVVAAHNPRNELAHALLLFNIKDGELKRHTQKHGEKPITEGFLKDKMDASAKAIRRCLTERDRLCQKLDTPPKLYY